MHTLISFTTEPHFFIAAKKRLDTLMQGKNIVFIEPYGAALSLLKHGVRKGYNIIILTADQDLRVVPSAILMLAALAIKIDTTDEVAILQLAEILQKIININAVIPGFEYFVPMTARLNDYFGLPSMRYADALKVRRKDLMRVSLQKAQLFLPRFSIVNSIAQVQQAITNMMFPLVCKPIDAAGSVNVRKANNHAELMISVKRILDGNDILWGHRLSTMALIEEYISGKEFSLEGVVHNHEVTHFSLTEKFVADQTEFIEIGHIVNVPVPAQLKSILESYINRVISVLKINNCPFHAEVRVQENGQPVLMEIAARLAGDSIGELICLSGAENYFDCIYAAYLQEGRAEKSLVHSVAGIRFFYRPTICSYSSVNGIDKIQDASIKEILLYYTPNQVIPAFPKPLRRLGHVIVKHHDYAELVKTLDIIDTKMVFLS
ncbi:MAG: phosphoribosylglycinamide synthetase [Gammaproteobacteria bacterium RIFCSPHIGHO2_12_FULL_41_20]|nr:MAG: phosphoribosylglycinamide synthetase [Gammaproteobacteria bacterium RIFCSPHIGHO2_12_FULL_41_20]